MVWWSYHDPVILNHKNLCLHICIKEYKNVAFLTLQSSLKSMLKIKISPDNLMMFAAAPRIVSFSANSLPLFSYRVCVCFSSASLCVFFLIEREKNSILIRSSENKQKTQRERRAKRVYIKIYVQNWAPGFSRSLFCARRFFVTIFWNYRSFRLPAREIEIPNWRKTRVKNGNTDKWRNEARAWLPN